MKPVLRPVLQWLSTGLLSLIAITVLAAPAAEERVACPLSAEVVAVVDRLVSAEATTGYRGTLLLEYGIDREFIAVDVDQATGLARLQHLNRAGGQTKELGLGVAALRTGCDLARYYRFQLEPGRVVAGRATQRLRVAPKDTLRLGYMMDLDAETGLPLRVVTAHPEGQVLERYEFADIKLWTSSVTPHRAPIISTAAGGLGFRGLPPGFVLVRQSEEPIGHVVVSDGLSVASVYVEPKPPALPTGEGVVWRGASLTYTRGRGDGALVTVLGEVPLSTARLLAEAIGQRR